VEDAVGANNESLRQHVRDIPDFPKPGILFRDLTPMLSHGPSLREAVHALAEPFRNDQIDYVLGTEARGFIFGAPVAIELGVGFVPIRKPGKLPYETHQVSYELEYGSDQVEMHVDALDTGHRVLVVDDLIATGGTAEATVAIARQAGAEVVACAFVIEIQALRGRARLGVDRVHAVLQY
jgi:adenine phosphoribosyltransferase